MGAIAGRCHYAANVTPPTSPQQWHINQGGYAIAGRRGNAAVGQATQLQVHYAG